MKSYFLITLIFSLLCFSCGSSSSSNSSTVTENPHAKAHQQMHNELIQEVIQSELPDPSDKKPSKKNMVIFESDHPNASLFKQKWDAGIIFYAKGSEKDWTLNIYQSSSLTFHLSDELNFSAAQITLLPSIDPKIIDYRAVSDKGEMIIQMVENGCAADLNGNTSYSLDISIKLKGEKTKTNLKGCGNFIPDPILNGNWIISKLDSIQLDPSLFNNKQPMLTMDLYKEKLSGNDGCNGFNGQVKFKLNKIVFGQTAGTLMACPNMEISGKIMNAFVGKSMTYVIEDDLILYNAEGGSLVLKREE